MVKALYDFNGSSDELSFKAGEEIVVVNEVLDDWWMGEIDGRQGLFPTSYTEIIGSTSPSSSSTPQQAPVSKSPKLPSLRLRRGSSGRKSATSTPKVAPVSLPLAATENLRDSDADHDRFLSSDADDDDARELSHFKPMGVQQKSPLFYSGFGHDSDSHAATDTGAVEDSETEGDRLNNRVRSNFDDDWVTFDKEESAGRNKQASDQPPPSATPKQRTMSLLGNFGNSLKIPIVDPAQQPLLSRSKSDDISLASPVTATESPVSAVAPSRGSPPKKGPPPPPPRRVVSQTPAPTPPVPLRRPGAGSSANSGSVMGSLGSSNASLLGLAGSTQSTPGPGYDQSPFESALELRVEGQGEGGKCERFRQNPFKPKGMCSNCLQYHD